MDRVLARGLSWRRDVRSLRSTINYALSGMRKRYSESENKVNCSDATPPSFSLSDHEGAKALTRLLLWDTAWVYDRCCWRRILNNKAAVAHFSTELRQLFFPFVRWACTACKLARGRQKKKRYMKQANSSGA